MKRPFMFAYSAINNSIIKEKVNQSGFDDCIDAPLNKLKIESVISEFLNMYAFNLTSQILSKLGPTQNLV